MNNFVINTLNNMYINFNYFIENIRIYELIPFIVIFFLYIGIKINSYMTIKENKKRIKKYKFTLENNNIKRIGE